MSETPRTYLEAVASLNAKQREAFLHPGNVVLLAGPGSGKTATLVLKVAKLLDEVPAPRGVACLTYANEAAREFERRLRGFGVRGGSRLFTGTVHAFCAAHILHPFGHLLPESQRYMATADVADNDATARARQKGLDEAGINENERWWSSKLSAYRSLAMIEPRFASDFDPRLPDVNRGYAQYLQERHLIDFDDIVRASLELVTTVPLVRKALCAKYPWIVIDEYQDLGLALHRVVLELMKTPEQRIFTVGDPDQSIYRFSGARPQFLEELAKRDGVRPVRLEMNYRCPQQIIDASLHVLQPPVARAFRAADDASKGEVFFIKRDSLEAQCEYVRERVQKLIADGVTAGKIGVFARYNHDIAACESVFQKASIPYRAVQGGGYRATRLTTWVADMARWCAATGAARRPRFSDLFDTYARLLRVLPRHGAAADELTARVELQRLLAELRDPELQLGDWARRVDERLKLSALDPAAVPRPHRHDVRELRAMLGALQGQLANQTIAEFCGLDGARVVLQTLHGSKGLEYKAVFMLALEEGVLPRYNPEDMHEERRLFYVGMTRTSGEVHLLFSGWYMAQGKKRANGPSSFLRELYNRMNPKT